MHDPVRIYHQARAQVQEQAQGRRKSRRGSGPKSGECHEIRRKRRKNQARASADQAQQAHNQAQGKLNEAEKQAQ